MGAVMRNLILFLIAFLAVVTFIRAFDKTDLGMGSGETLNIMSQQVIVETRLAEPVTP